MPASHRSPARNELAHRKYLETLEQELDRAEVVQRDAIPADVIEWQLPKGMRRLKVLEVVYQPEAAGVRED